MLDDFALGETVKKPSSLYPRPGSYGTERPIINWAVMQGPFGNEFCLMDGIAEDQSMAAVAVEGKTHHDRRLAAGVATQPR